jgi:hypothetical protein
MDGALVCHYLKLDSTIYHNTTGSVASTCKKVNSGPSCSAGILGKTLNKLNLFVFTID